MTYLIKKKKKIGSFSSACFYKVIQVTTWLHFLVDRMHIKRNWEKLCIFCGSDIHMLVEMSNMGILGYVGYSEK